MYSAHLRMYMTLDRHRLSCGGLGGSDLISGQQEHGHTLIPSSSLTGYKRTNQIHSMTKRQRNSTSAITIKLTLLSSVVLSGDVALASQDDWWDVLSNF